MLDQLHFIEPRWFLALIPLAFVIWLNSRFHNRDNPWANIVDSHLQALLIHQQGQTKNSLALWLLSIGWIISVVALANPAWDKQPQPLFQSNAARVVVLDLSMSMNARDLKPSRLQRARFKVADLLEMDNEGQTGLVVFAGDAFTVSPLTHDTDTIQSLLKVLDPSIVPTQGSNVYQGLLKAKELLQDSGFTKGEVILVADGVAGKKAEKAARELRNAGYTVSVLGVGTAEGAPVLKANGRPYKNVHGIVVTARLYPDQLKAVASEGGGKYTEITSDSSDIENLLNNSLTADSEKADNNELTSDEWKSEGPYFVLLLLPLAALAFRRGWLLSVFLMVGVLSPTSDALAFSWQDLWQRPDQQANKALQNKEYDAVETLTDIPSQLGTASYRKDDYESALQHFKAEDSADATYNKGNALAKLGKYEDAIKAYDEALSKQTDMEDAAYNKAEIEKLLQQQEQQQQSSDSDKDSDEQEEQKDSDQQSSQDSENESEKPGEGEGDNENQEDPSDNQFSDTNKEMDKESEEQEAEKAEQQAENEGEESEEEKSQQEMQQAEQEDTEEQDAQPAEAEQLTTEEQLAAEQWLRRIPDDPGGLLRRKFYYQYSNRTEEMSRDAVKPW